MEQTLLHFIANTVGKAIDFNDNEGFSDKSSSSTINNFIQVRKYQVWRKYRTIYRKNKQSIGVVITESEVGEKPSYSSRGRLYYYYL